jgi:hypothetical protein
MTAMPMPVREEIPRASPEEAPSISPTKGPAPALAPAGTGPLPAEELVALAVAAGAADPGVAADRVYAAADGSRDRLSAAASLLIERLKLRSDDFEASLGLRIVERALVRAPYPDGPWRWAHDLDPRRVRAAKRRRRRAVRRRRSGPRLPDRGAWRRAWRRTRPTRY